MKDLANNYGKAAVEYAEACIKNKSLPSRIGWEVFLCEEGFTVYESEKGCPKNTFLSLCEHGHIKGIPAGHYLYSYSCKEYDYAKIALLLLREKPLLCDTPDILWTEVMKKGGFDITKTHNHQMYVVCYLWKAKLINQ